MNMSALLITLFGSLSFSLGSVVGMAWLQLHEPKFAEPWYQFHVHFSDGSHAAFSNEAAYSRCNLILLPERTISRSTSPPAAAISTVRTAPPTSRGAFPAR